MVVRRVGDLAATGECDGYQGTVMWPVCVCTCVCCVSCALFVYQRYGYTSPTG